MPHPRETGRAGDEGAGGPALHVQVGFSITARETVPQDPALLPAWPSLDPSC